MKHNPCEVGPYRSPSGHSDGCVRCSFNRGPRNGGPSTAAPDRHYWAPINNSYGSAACDYGRGHIRTYYHIGRHGGDGRHYIASSSICTASRPGSPLKTQCINALNYASLCGVRFFYFCIPPRLFAVTTKLQIIMINYFVHIF